MNFILKYLTLIDFYACLLSANHSNTYRFQYEIETTQPSQLQITIYETSLEQSDTLRLQEEEFHIPNPTLSSDYYRGQYGTSFYLDSQVYDFR